MDLIDAIKVRKSVRAYDGEPLTSEQRSELEQAIDDAKSPFGGNIIIKLAQFDLSVYRPSTYGVITGACDYLLMGVGDSEDSLLSAGFTMEQVVLRATQIGLGTCWIAATFKGSNFSRAISLPTGQSLKIISPIGYPVAKRSFKDKITRLIAGSDHRLPFEKLFFNGDFTRQLSCDNLFANSLAMLRLAPSSMNSQPWRAVVIENARVDFYCKSKGDLSLIDMGIGLCHFDVAAGYYGLYGHWSRAAIIPSGQHGLKYVASFILD